MSGEITKQEFFDEQQQLTNVVAHIREIENKINEFNRSNGITRGKLTDKEKSQIYHYYKTGNYKQSQLSEMFCVTQAAISGVLSKYKK
jgi:predicted XRE-type DNA-binding protein